MKFYSVYDEEFRPYGKVHEGYDTAELVKAMDEIPLPESGTRYMPSIESLENCAIFKSLGIRSYGGMPIQLGMCWGHNTKLNCFEYHRDSELNLGSSDFVLLLAKQGDIVDGKIDSSKAKAFRVPAGVLVEVYATSLHFAPCQVSGDGFRVAVVLPRGTNTEKPVFEPVREEDRWLRARNKWLIAHPEAPQAKDSAYVGITGENTDIGDLSR
ncbi:MAG: DUF4867 family protein [Spirochaetales bacterium]|nr:DUF4867 family protein [Spirochaetales bacterium]